MTMICSIVKNNRFQNCAALLLAIFSTTVCPAATTETKIALVIGNSAYPSAALKNPVNDAKAMAATLGNLGFEVILRTDASQREMTRAVSQFGDKLKGGSVGLFYFAGHGMQVRGKNFLIPVDAEINSESSTRSEAVDVDQVLEQLGSARLSMVILDACRNNPFERRFRSAGNGGLAQIDAPTGTMLAYATAPGKVAYDGTGANGLYTTELLKALDTPGLKVEDVFKQVRINVLKASDNQQIPWESSSLTGEFYFKPEVKSQSTDASNLTLAKERAQLQKSLEEERRRREQDAESVRKEMENLRKELLAIRQDTAPSNAITPSSPRAEWTPRIALLDELKGNLSLSKALAILFDFSNTADLEELIKFENTAYQLAYSHAVAIGINSKGIPFLVYGGKFSTASYARGELLEFCRKSTVSMCKVILVNREFDENEFLSFAKTIQQTDLSVVRQSILESLRQPMATISVYRGVSGGYQGQTNIYYTNR